MYLTVREQELLVSIKLLLQCQIAQYKLQLNVNYSKNKTRILSALEPLSKNH